jgi:hypothetical protein
MPAPALFTFFQKNAKQIHDDFIRTIKNGLIALGVTNPNVGPNSDYDLIATAVGNELAVVQANAVILADQLMPDTAGGAYLDRWLALVGLSRRPAIASSGVFTIPTPTSSNSQTNIPVNAQLYDSAGLLFQVTVGGTYGVGTGLTLQVPCVAVQGGKATNHANGDSLSWVKSPAYLGPTVVVGTPGGTNGLSGGSDSEVGLDEPPRQRLLQLLQNPPKGGNPADIAGWATQSSQSAQAAFPYPALQGPGTVFFAVMAQPQSTGPFTSTSMSRAVPTTTVVGTIVPYVQGLLPGQVYCVGSSTVDQPTDVALFLALPSAPTASPPGPGGGWVDGTPWPSTLSGTFVPQVSAVTNSTTFQVQVAPNSVAPTPGVSHIAYVSPNVWTLYQATVLTATAVGNNLWNITIDTPFPDVFVGAFVFPQAVQQANYFAAALQAFANLGPGEWTANVTALQRAYRHPVPSLVWPSALDSNFLRTMENAGPEVETARYLFTSGSTPLVPSTITVSAAGALTSTPPAVLTPRNLGWYAS